MPDSVRKYKKIGDKYNMSFDYKKFEKELLEKVEGYAKDHLEDKDDLYILSVDYFPEFTTSIAIRANTFSYLSEQSDPSDEDYTYYKYCEEEWDWDIFEDLDELSEDLQKYYSELEDAEDEDAGEEHTTKIIEVCKNVLKAFKETDTYKVFPKLYLNVYVREYFDEEEAIEIFGELNGEDSKEEYADWL